MVKKLSTLLLATMAISGANAQVSTSKAPFKHHKKSQLVSQRLAAQQAKAGGPMSKTTGSGQKLIALSGRESGMLSDTIHYSWSGNRTLNHFVNPLQIVTYSDYNAASPEIPSATGLRGRRYPLLQADSMYYYYEDMGLTILSNGIVNTYDANDMLLKSDTKYNGYMRNYTDITYNANGKIVTALNYADTTMMQNGAYLLSNAVYCTYNSSNQLIEDSTVQYLYGPAVSFNTAYLKDANGLDTSIQLSVGPTLFQAFRMSYTTTGLLQTFKSYSYSFGAPELTQADTMSYTGSQTYPSFYESIYFYNNAIDYGTREYATLNANEDVDNQVYVEYDSSIPGWDTSVRFQIYYNPFDNADSLVADVYDPFDNTWENGVFKYTYYYENGTTSVPAVPKSASLKLYPNPATDVMHLTIADVTVNDAGTVSITDAAGRLVRQLSFHGNAITVPTASLPTGVYHLQYQSGNKQGAATFVKQ